MEKSKRLTQEEKEEVISILVNIGLMIVFKSRDYKEYLSMLLHTPISDVVYKYIERLIVLSPLEIELILQKL